MSVWWSPWFEQTGVIVDLTRTEEKCWKNEKRLWLQCVWEDNQIIENTCQENVSNLWDIILNVQCFLLTPLPIIFLDKRRKSLCFILPFYHVFLSRCIKLFIVSVIKIDDNWKLHMSAVSPDKSTSSSPSSPSSSLFLMISFLTPNGFTHKLSQKWFRRVKNTLS